MCTTMLQAPEWRRMSQNEELLWNVAPQLKDDNVWTVVSEDVSLTV